MIQREYSNTIPSDKPLPTPSGMSVAHDVSNHCALQAAILCINEACETESYSSHRELIEAAIGNLQGALDIFNREMADRMEVR